MGFVGGGCNIAITTVIPPSFVYWKHQQIVYRFSLSNFLCLPEASVSGWTYPFPRRPVPDVCRILYSNVRGRPGILVIWPLLRLSMIYSCALRLWSQICVTGLRYASRVGVVDSRIRSLCLAMPGQDASGPRDGCMRTRWLQSISLPHIRLRLLQNAGF